MSVPQRAGSLGNLRLPQTAEEGDRAWVARLAELLEQRLRTKLGESPKLYLDTRASWNGLVDENLGRAIESSALFAFVESPGSCKPGSWCGFEVRHFLDRATPIVSAPAVITREERLFKGVLEPVAPEKQPDVLRNVVGRRLHERGTPATFQDPTSPASQELQALVEDLAAVLKRARDLSAPAPSGSTVFVSAASDLNHARLRELRRAAVKRR